MYTPCLHASEKDLSITSLRNFRKKKKRNSSPRVARKTKNLFARSLENSREKEETFLNNIRLESLRGGGIKRHTSNEHLLGLAPSANTGAIRPPCTCRECTYSQILSRVLASIFVYVFSRRWKGDWECREWKREELQVSLLEWGINVEFRE